MATPRLVDSPGFQHHRPRLMLEIHTETMSSDANIIIYPQKTDSLSVNLLRYSEILDTVAQVKR